MRSAYLRASRFDLSLLRSVRFVRIVVAALSIMLVGNSVAYAAGVPMDPVKLKKSLTDRGIGKGVSVKELDGTTVSGILTGVHDDSLDVTPNKTVQAVTIQYAQVASVHSKGMSTVAKVGIGVGIGVVAVIAFIVISLKASGF